MDIKEAKDVSKTGDFMNIDIDSGNWVFYKSNDEISIQYIDVYIEKHAHRIRAKYLSFIADLSRWVIGSKTMAEHFQLKNGYNLWWMSLLAEKSTYKSPAIADCIKLLALEEILVDSQIGSVILSGANSNIIEALRILCEGLGIKLTVKYNLTKQRSFRKKIHLRFIYKKIPHAIRGIFFYFRHITSLWFRNRIKKATWFSGVNSIFIFSYFIHLDAQKCREGVFYSRQWEILPAILRSSGINCNWLHHFLISESACSPSDGLKLIDKFNSDPLENGKHAFINGYLDILAAGKVLLNFFGCFFSRPNQSSVEKAFRVRDSVVSLWPVLKEDWMSSTQGTVAMQNLLWIFQMDKAFMQMPRQPLGLYLNENQGWERALIHAWKKHGHGELIGVQHSSLRFWDLRYYEDQKIVMDKSFSAQPQPHHVALNGPAAVEFYIEAGYSEKSFLHVETLRYLERARKGSPANSVAKQKINIIILGDILMESNKALLKIMETIPQDAFSLTVKSHPGAIINKNDYPSLNLREETGALSKILTDFDIAIAVGSTTAALDAYLSGLQVIVFLMHGELNLSSLRGVEDVSFVKNAECLVQIINKYNKGSCKSDGRRPYFWDNKDLPYWCTLLSKYYSI